MIERPTIIVQAGQYADYLGTLDVEFDKNGVVVGHEGELIKIADKAEDPEAAEILKTYPDKIEEVKNEANWCNAVKLHWKILVQVKIIRNQVSVKMKRH